MDQATRDDIFTCLCEMSDRRVADVLKPRIAALIGRTDADIKDEFLGIIDDAVYCALLPDIYIQYFEKMWMSFGGTKEELIERGANWENNTDFKNKYKWQYCGCGDDQSQ